jgi:hypothetical protein
VKVAPTLRARLAPSVCKTVCKSASVCMAVCLSVFLIISSASQVSSRHGLTGPCGASVLSVALAAFSTALARVKAIVAPSVWGTRSARRLAMEVWLIVMQKIDKRFSFFFYVHFRKEILSCSFTKT